MPIHRLPQHLINRLKAGEIVERPAALVKELLENSIDAWATQIRIEVTDAGMTRLLISDDGTGISRTDLPLTIERYATSKIAEEADLEHIMSYGFRGEALASIAEVSTMRIQTRSADEVLPAGVGRELSKVDEQVHIKELPFAHPHGTTIIIEHLFANIPARKKFLKSATTEWTHVHHVLLNYFLAHPQIAWTVIKDAKTIYQLSKVDTLLERVQALFDKERGAHLREIILWDEQVHIYGLISDTTLHFPTGDHIYLYVNHRPVTDKLLRKALLDMYQRQMPGNRFPFAVIFLDCLPTLVDCNVHPKKQEVRFLDPGSMFQRVQQAIETSFGEQKVHRAQHPNASFSPARQTTSPWYTQYGAGHQQSLDLPYQAWFTSAQSLQPATDTTVQLDNETLHLVGQLRDSYIILTSQDFLYYVDQHALAERITFERMRQQIEEQWLVPELLLQPLLVRYPQMIDIERSCEQLREIGFDASVFDAQQVILYAVPQALVTHRVDIQRVLEQLWLAPEISLQVLLDEILATKACKASIKAGQPLSFPEMQRLLVDGQQRISKMFVCQHGRPSIVKIPKNQVDKLFAR